MKRLTKKGLEDILNKRLGLEDPVYMLEKAGNRLVGNIVSKTFKGKRDHARQKMIWDALDAELGKESYLRVGMLLPYTPDEWNIDDL